MSNLPQTPLRVAFYLRVSTDEQAEKYGLPAQEEALFSYLKSQGKLENGQYKLIHVKTYKDDISGTLKIDERPKFSQLKEDIIKSPKDQKPFDIVAVYKIDRFARKLKVLMDIIELFGEYDIKLISATESIDTTTPFGRAMLGIIGVIAELEIENIKQRTSSGRLQAAHTGVMFGSNAKYGFIKDTNKRPIIFEKEAKIIKEIFNLFIYQKLTPQMIANQFTLKQMPTPQVSAVINNKYKGKIIKKNPIDFWRANTVRSILNDVIYIGEYYFNKHKGNKLLPKSEWKRSNYHFPQIISRVDFEKAQNLLLHNSSRIEYKKKEHHLYLLASLLKCNHCKDLKDNTMINWLGEPKKITKTKIVYYYECGRKNQSKFATSCNTLPLPAEEIETYIINFIKKLLNNPVAVYNYQLKLKSNKLELKHIDTDIKRFGELYDGIDTQKERLNELYVAGKMRKEKLNIEYEELNKKFFEYKKQLTELTEQRDSHIFNQGYIESLELFKEKYIKTLDDIYTNREGVFRIIHSIIQEITIYSRPKTDNDKIAGRKKQNQLIPYRLHIKLRLPKDILQNMYSSKKYTNNFKPEIDFGVENAKL